jgi:type II secretory pathway pseudopilin PulG
MRNMIKSSERNALGCCPPNSRESGFTVIEIAVGVIIFTIVMGAIYGLLTVARSGRLNTNQRAEVLQNARIAINTISRDAINAGVGYPNLGATLPDNCIAAVLGSTADEDTAPDVLTPVYARDSANTVNGVATDQITFLFIDDTFSGGTSLPISEINDEGGELQIADGFTNAPCLNASDEFRSDIYIITGQNGSALGMCSEAEDSDEGDIIPFADNDPLGLNNPGPDSPIGKIQAPASLLRVWWVSYYVAPEDGNGTGTGTLMRRVYGGAGGFVDQPLAFGVENMQVQYVLENGTVVDVPPSVLIPATEETPAQTLTSMDDIRQVRLSVTVRSPDRDPNTNEPFRSTLTSTFSTRNLVYEKI